MASTIVFAFARVCLEEDLQFHGNNDMLLTLDISVGDNDKNMLSAQVMSDTVVPDSYAGIDSLSINRLWKDNKWEDLRVIEVDSQVSDECGIDQ
ncbi:hypothetical protein V6N12_044438 [Hibiscus sabdariffa]